MSLRHLNRLENKEGKPQAYWDSFLDKLTRKRNHQMRDMANKAARIAIEHCLARGIGTIVVGWNRGIKNCSDMGSKSNQQFVQMSLAKLKERIKQLCEIYGIRYVETEEANTSCASYLDGDTLPERGKKPDGWTKSFVNFLLPPLIHGEGWGGVKNLRFI